MFLARRAPVVLALGALIVLGACGDDGGGSPTDGGGRPTVAVTTSLLGDVVANLVGDAAEVVTIMPAGADPHDFQASAQQVAELRQADAAIANGGGFEEGLVGVLESAADDGLPVFEALSATEAIPAGGGHGGSSDPHFFADPTRVADAAAGIRDFLADNVPGLADEALADRSTSYIDELRALDAEVEALLAEVPPEDRILVTNHDVFGYFADRYDFEVLGTVIPAGSTSDAASGGNLSDLADTIRAEDVPAIFADRSSADELASTLAAEVGDVEVVELFTESLGGPGTGGDTYLDMMRTNARRIADALA